MLESSENTTWETPNNFTSTGESQLELPSLNLLYAVIGSFVTFTTFFEQIIVFVVFYTNRKLQKANNFYMIALAMADFLLSLVSMPVWTMFSTLQYWPTSQILCDIWNILDHILTFVSIHIVVFISVERYRSLKYPLQHMASMRGKRIIFWLTLIWIMDTIFWTICIYAAEYIYKIERNPLECIEHFTSEPLLLVTHGLMCLLTPALITAVYILIYGFAKDSGVATNKATDKSLRNQASSSDVDSFDNEETWDSSRKSVISSIFEHLANEGVKVETFVCTTKKGERKTKTGKKAGKERKALKTIALLLVTFAVCWIPLGIYDIVETIFPGSFSISWLIAFYWMGYANSMLNPLCYAAGNRQFRESLRKLLTCRKKILRNT